MANTQQLENPAIPELPTAGSSYSGQLANQSNGLLRTFFIKLAANLRALFGPRGGQFLNIPYGAWQDGTNQTAALTTTAYPITYSMLDFENGITLSNSSRLNVSQSGMYNAQFSLQLQNTSNAGEYVDVWFRKNGSDIANSNSRFALPARPNAITPAFLIAAINFFIDMQAGDYMELVWRTSSVDVSIISFPADTSPTRPAVPSVIVTMSYVSNIYS